MELSKNPLVKLQCKFGYHNHSGALSEDEQKGMFRLINDGEVDALVGFFLCSSLYCTGCGKISESSLTNILSQVNRHLRDKAD